MEPPRGGWLDSLTEALLLAALGGLFVGLFLTVFGGGGSVLATPWLIFVIGVVDPHIAIGTSAAAVSVNALGGLIAQARAGRVKWPCASVFAVAGLAGAWGGAALGKVIDGDMLLNWFAVAMIAIAVSMLLPRKSEGDPDVRFTPRMILKLAPVGLAAGFAAGLFGIGGGFLIAPGLIASTGMTLANAAASSLLSVTLFGAATSTSYALSGLVDWPLFLGLIVGGGVGILAGLPIARLLVKRETMARWGFAAMVVAVAIYILVR